MAFSFPVIHMKWNEMNTDWIVYYVYIFIKKPMEVIEIFSISLQTYSGNSSNMFKGWMGATVYSWARSKWSKEDGKRSRKKHNKSFHSVMNWKSIRQFQSVFCVITKNTVKQCAVQTPAIPVLWIRQQWKCNLTWTQLY